MLETYKNKNKNFEEEVRSFYCYWGLFITLWTMFYMDIFSNYSLRIGFGYFFLYLYIKH